MTRVQSGLGGLETISGIEDNSPRPYRETFPTSPMSFVISQRRIRTVVPDGWVHGVGRRDSLGA
jgi:hypothetical protein